MKTRQPFSETQNLLTVKQQNLSDSNHSQSTPNLNKNSILYSAGHSQYKLSAVQSKQQLGQFNQSVMLNGGDIDDKQMRQALDQNFMDKQDRIDKLQMFIQKLNYELQSKIERCDYLRSIYDTKSSETSETEQTLKKEILEISERLEILSLFTKREKFSSKQLKDKNTYKLDIQEQKLEKLQKEKDELIDQLQQIEVQVKQQQEEKEVKLRAALRPLQDARSEIQQQEQIFSTRKKVCEQHKERLENLLNRQRNEESKISQNVDYLHNDIARLNGEMNEIKQDHMDEFEIFLKEYDEEKQLKKIVLEKKKIDDKINKQEKICKKLKDEVEKIDSEINDPIKKQQDKVNKALRELNNFKPTQQSMQNNNNLKRNHEIAKVEKFLKDKESEFKSQNLTEVICQETQMQEIAKKYQIPYLEKQLQILTDAFMEDDQKREEELNALKLEIINHNPLPNSNNNNTLNPNLTQINEETEDASVINTTTHNSVAQACQHISSHNAAATLKWVTQRYNQALETQKEQRFLFKRKATLLQQKVNEYRAIKIAQQGFDLEQAKVVYLKKIWARMNCDQEERQNFQNILDMYIERVEQREDFLSKTLVEKQQVTEQYASKQDLLDKKRQQLVSQHDQVEQWQQQSKELHKSEKVLSKSLEDRQTQVEFQLFKFGEKNFEEYYAKHEQLFEGVKKTYGKKVCDKMKTQQKREFIEITVQQYKRRIQELKNRQMKIEENQSQIGQSQKKLREQLMVEISKIETDLRYQLGELRVVEFQLQATRDALVEINREIDSLTASRQLDIKKMIQQLFKTKNYDSQKVRLQTLESEISKKQKLVYRLRLEVEDKETTVFEKTTNYKAEEGQLKVRLDNFKKAMSEIQKTIKPQLIQMEREVKELGYQINSGRRKLESIFEKYKEVLHQQALIKKTINERFNSNVMSTQEDLRYQRDHIEVQQFKQFTNQENENDDIHFENVEGDNIPRISTQGFQFDEEYKKMQNIIDADERMKCQPINNQIIQEISEEYDDDDKSNKTQCSISNIQGSKNQESKLNTTKSKLKNAASSKKLEVTENNIDRNMHELLGSSSNDISRATHFGGEGVLEINTISGEKIGIDMSNCPDNEVEFYHKIKILLEGEEIYKKFGTSSSMTQKPFDPLDSKSNPESKGYGKRFLKVSPDFAKMDFFKQNLNNGSVHSTSNQQDSLQQSNSSANINAHASKLQHENFLNIEKIMKLVIPTVTQDIIKYQKQIGHQKQMQSLAESSSMSALIKTQKQLIGVKRDQEEYKDKCLNARCYPFSLVLSDKTLELVSHDYFQFKFITEGLEEMLKKKSQLNKLAKKIIIC